MRGRRTDGPARSRRPTRRLPPREARSPASLANPSPLPAEQPPTMHAAIQAAEDVLDAAGVEESVADARLLLACALGASPTWVFTHEKEALPSGAWEPFRRLVARRCAREPLQHIRGEQEFFGLRFRVGPKVLIPRPETELVVERLIAHVHSTPQPRVADVGTGSGCIAIAAATEIPSARVVASDVSPEALEAARANARELGVERRVTFELGSLGDPLRGHAPFHALAANLPYVTTDEWSRLQPEVRDFEPALALLGGEDGLDLVRELVAQAPALLAPGGWIVLEIGQGQAEGAAALLRARGFEGVAVHPDLAGIGRVVEGRTPMEPEAR